MEAGMAAARTKAEEAEEAEATAQAAHLEGSAVLRLGAGLERGEHGGVEGLELDLSIPASLVAVRTGRLVALAHLEDTVHGAWCKVQGYGGGGARSSWRTCVGARCASARCVAVTDHILELDLRALVTEALHEGLEVLRLDRAVAALVEQRERLLQLPHLLLRHRLRAIGHHK
eukprot:scaffold3946_cov42-Phaeocystis_antarctica.AAC.1